MITITLVGLIKFLIIIYLLFALAMFISFLTRSKELTMTITRHDLNTKTELHGFKKVKWFFICSLLWPITIHFSRGE